MPFERLTAAEIRRQFPQFVFDDDLHAIWQADGGVLASRKANAAHRRLAKRNGARLVDNAPVKSTRQINGGYEIKAGEQIFEGEKLVVAAGPWTNLILSHFGLHLPLAVTHEQVSYFTPLSADAFVPKRFPVWIWMILDNYYAFPVYGETESRSRRIAFPVSIRTSAISSPMNTTKFWCGISCSGIFPWLQVH